MATEIQEGNKKINPNLVKERKRCTFNTLELTHLLDGGEDMTRERKNRGNYKYRI